MMMGEATLVLPDERKLTLFLSNRALLIAERTYGKPLEALLADMKEGFASALSAILFGALHKHHSDLSEDDATDLLMDHSKPVMAALHEAFGAALPDEDGEGNVPRPRRGKNSGGAGAKRGSNPEGSGKKRHAATT